MAAHGIPYAATASIGYLPDFMRKVERAGALHGTRYLHVIAPCPTGWGCAVDETIDVAKEIVDCGLWYLAEYEGPQTLAEQAAAGEPAAQGEQATKGAPAIQPDAASGGRFTLNRNPREFSSVEAYLRRQGRFKQLADEDVAAITAARDAKWAAMRRDWA